MSNLQMYDYVLRLCLFVELVYQSVVSLLCRPGLLRNIFTPAGIKPSTETLSVSDFIIKPPQHPQGMIHYQSSG